MPKNAEKLPRKLAKEVYTSGLSRKEDKAVVKDYTFIWDDSGKLKKLVVNYRHFQDSEALHLFFKKENDLLLSNPDIERPTVRKMIVDRDWAVAEAKGAFLEGFGVYNLLTCVTGKTGPTLRRQDSNEVTQKRKLHERARKMTYDASANCSHFVMSPGQQPPESSRGFDGDLYAVFDMFSLDDRIPLAIRRPIGQRMMTLESYGPPGQKKAPLGTKAEVPMTFAEELMAKTPAVQDILRQTKSFWIPYQTSQDTMPRTLVFFTPDVERSWQIFDVSTDDEAQNFVGIKSRQQAFDFVSGQILFRFFSNDLASRWSEMIVACGEHVMSLKASLMAETSMELAQKIWEGEVFWKYLDQTIEKQIEVLQMFCSELKASETRDFSLVNLEEEDMQWINAQFVKLKRLIAQNLIEPTHTNMQMLFTIASLREAQTGNQYGASMNRLSWVTFIFLPLTFLTGVFGMNVDTFQENPSIVWYVIGIVPLIAMVSMCWFISRKVLQLRGQRLSQQGIHP